MAQKRDKDEMLDLQVPAETPLSLSSCPDNCKLACPDPVRVVDPIADIRIRRFQKRVPEREDPSTSASEQRVCGDVAARKAVIRCCGCGKRVGLTGFRCRCGDLFCSEHRYSDRHDCSFDYKAAARETIARENPVVRAAKILKV